MATNNNGNLLDSAGEVAIDFVWGNFPIQPNDARPDAASATLSTTVTTRVAGRLDPAADSHIIALSGWNGYPLYTPDTEGEDVLGATDYVVVPSVVGLTTAIAVDLMKDASLTVTTAAGATNDKQNITRFNATSTTSAVVYVGTASTFYPVGTKVTLATGTAAGSDPVNLPAYAKGTWTVTAATSTTITISGTGFTVADTTGINETDNIYGVAGTIKAQSIAAGANEIAPAAAVTVTPFAAAS
jgi:hypothetical protein